MHKSCYKFLVLLKNKISTVLTLHQLLEEINCLYIDYSGFDISMWLMLQPCLDQSPPRIKKYIIKENTNKWVYQLITYSKGNFLIHFQTYWMKREVEFFSKMNILYMLSIVFLIHYQKRNTIYKWPMYNLP